MSKKPTALDKLKALKSKNPVPQTKDLVDKAEQLASKQVDSNPLAKFKGSSGKTMQSLTGKATGLNSATKQADTKKAELQASMAKLKAKHKATAPTKPIDRTEYLKREQATRAPAGDSAQRARIQNLKLDLPPKQVLKQIPELAPIVEKSGRVEKHEITYELLNTQQRKAVDMAVSGNDFVLIGSAGTGKTTTQRIVLQTLAESGLLKPMGLKADGSSDPDWEHKYLVKGTPSIAVMSFVNKAVNNIRSALPAEFSSNALTIHKFVEFAPSTEVYLDIDEETGESVEKEKDCFLPQRHSENPVLGLTHIVIEEASTIGMDLWEYLLDALPNRGADITFIFLGDIKQLPPVFGQSILADKLQNLPIVELSEVYRTAAESPILSLAIAINEGKPIDDATLRSDYHTPGELEFVNLSGIKKDKTKMVRRSPELLIRPIVNTFKKLLDSGEFVPFRDVILCPFRVNRNDGVNCDNINIRLADYHGKQRKAVIHEVIAGINKQYLAIDDPIYLNKVEYRITDIQRNNAYKGMPPNPPSEDMDRWGHYDNNEDAILDMNGDSEVDRILKIDISKMSDDDEKLRTASHKIIVERIDANDSLNATREVTAVSDINSIEFAYALTVHKAIGSEWERVYCIFHHSMSGMLSRELVYTAVTRAKLYLQVIYDGHDHHSFKSNTSMLAKAIISPSIKGETIEEKIDWLVKEAAKKGENTNNLLSKYQAKN